MIYYGNYWDKVKPLPPVMIDETYSVLCQYGRGPWGDLVVIEKRVVKGREHGHLRGMTREEAEAEVARFESQVSTRVRRALDRDPVPAKWGWRRWRPDERRHLLNAPAEVTQVFESPVARRDPSGNVYRDPPVWIVSPFTEADVPAFMAERLQKPAAAGWTWDLDRGLVLEVP